ncbi:MAG: hypothetical protein HYV99_01885 [Betaproteobacteria bacterium]|nr:hypothetical protein [Betaproteobacteria bacterium]
MELERRLHRRHSVAPALFAGRDHDRLPVREPFHGPLLAQSHHVAGAHERLDPGDAQLHRLLHGVVHALAARNRLCERHRERRLAIDRAAPGDIERRGILADALDFRAVFIAVAVEKRDRITGAQPQRARHVARLGGRQRAFPAGAQVAVYEYTGGRLCAGHRESMPDCEEGLRSLQ